MPNLVQTYAIHDAGGGTKGAVRIHRDEARKWNSEGYGIFHTVQYFLGPRRINNLQGINAWYVDLDKGLKIEMRGLIEKGLPPTLVVETKNGFHVYWKAKDGSVENWRAIMETRLIPFYNADKKAKDLARLLRVPGYLHQKDPNDPFLVTKIHELRVEYSEREMFAFYRDEATPKKQKKMHRAHSKENPGMGGFWDQVWNMDCEAALDRLSGSRYVGGEIYSFRVNASGTKNIYVNGKGSSCWIDQDGRIGSMDGGGPTVAAWLNWFHKDWKNTVAILKEVFPELNQAEQQVLI